MKIIKNNRNGNRRQNGPIIKFSSAYDRNNVLTTVKRYIKDKKGPHQLNLVGFVSDEAAVV